MIIFVYAMKELGVPIVSKRALNTKIQNVMTLCLALYINTIHGRITSCGCVLVSHVTCVVLRVRSFFT